MDERVAVLRQPHDAGMREYGSASRPDRPTFRVCFLARCPNGRFTAIKRVSIPAWILLVYVAPASPQTSAEVVVPSADVVSRVVVRASASSQSADIGSIGPGWAAELLGSVPRWYRVRLDVGVEGFVSKRWTQVIPWAAATAFTVRMVDVGTGLGVVVTGEDFALVYDGGSNNHLDRGERNRMLGYLQRPAATPNSSPSQCSVQEINQSTKPAWFRT